ncbi:MAG TPA: hypothetical protein GXZ65_04140 [Clostridiales bacterium]|jgi:flagellar biosynthesis protein|nr:hypothetical protein [Clostridiales bacterium]
MSESKKKAAALKYDPEQDMAPVVLASGYGPIAEQIIDIAEQHGIPVYRDDSTASMLCMLEVGSNIPPELYQIIASVYTQILLTASKAMGHGEAHHRSER